MLFNSLPFLIFFPVVTLLYYLAPPPRRWIVLLAASAWFYMSFIPAYILILLALILLDYAAALAMERRVGRARRAVLALSLVANVGMLGAFKYFDFLNANLGRIAGWLGFVDPIRDLSLILPLGLSFHTFQSMSYTIEVYRGNQKAERHLGYYALYVMFYPQLVAGPIERPGHLLPQLRAEHRPDLERMASGLRLMLNGFFKKVAIADTLALGVDAVYRDPSRFSAAALLAAVYLFAFQIYYDFSGYTDIARGCARVMGIELVANFDRPFAAASIPEFWRRWHMSLSSWFRDYLYIPLGGNRAGPRRRALNLLLVFAVAGLWHGANWTYVVWGLVQGLGMVVTLLAAQGTARLRDAIAADGLARRAWDLLAAVATFHFFALTLILVRSASLAQAALIARGLASGFDWSAPARELGGPLLAISAALIAAMELAERRERRALAPRPGAEVPFLRRSLSLAWVLALVAIIAVRATYDAAPQPFFYFQF